MLITTQLPLNAPPTSPGEYLLEEFLNPLGMTQAELGKATGLGPRAINEICKGKRSVTPRTAILFSDVFGNSVEFWLSAQHAVELWLELKSLGRLKEALKDQMKPVSKAALKNGLELKKKIAAQNSKKKNVFSLSKKKNVKTHSKASTKDRISRTNKQHTMKKSA